MKKGQIGYFIIASAVVWGAVLIGCALVLKGTPYKEEVNRIIMGGSVFHLLFIWSPMGLQFRKNKEKSGENKSHSADSQ